MAGWIGEVLTGAAWPLGVWVLPDGITGLSREQTMGAEYYRSASAIWSGNVTDAYFLAGGVLFGLLGRRYRPASARDTGRVRLAGRPATVGR